MGGHSRLAREAGIAGIGEPGRSSGDHLAHGTCVKSRQAEIVNIALFERHRKEGIPAKTVGKRQLGRRFPGVLGVSPEEVLRQVVRIRILLPQLRHVSGEEIAQARAGNGSVHRKITRGKGVCRAVQKRAHHVDAERELVRAANHGHVVVGAEVGDKGVEVRGKTGADGERALDG